MLQWREFKREIDALVTIYRQDNAWVGQWKGCSWDHDYHMYHYIRAAYLLYEATARNELRYVLLGGTGIRKSREYIRQFGVTAANGIQDPETVEGVRRADRFRAEQAGQPRAQAAANPDDRVIPAQGFGSILSEQRWTPILNDALIIGAATARHEFMLAFEPYELGILRECQLSIQDQLRKRTPNPTQDEAYWPMVWNRFFKFNKNMFWDARWNIPRVLTRELIGLARFGYQVRLTPLGVGFRPPANEAPDPTFATYVRGLRNMRFHEPGARARIMEELSVFLLGDSHALCFRADEHLLAGRPNVGHPTQFI
ncbi:hypothetical protein [Roseibium sediminicola]|uniref:Uncharacterized protein n=1 Tax=Roseibium sediminicola TaxID=2933272 RepID=A0ABT0GX50_9HYPH|nr:hypothetical protein [Roseibium sp. CAU 1639]MCK7614014.1 hypothetical protein [Roseibium sp. CAU 1639]